MEVAGVALQKVENFRPAAPLSCSGVLKTSVLFRAGFLAPSFAHSSFSLLSTYIITMSSSSLSLLSKSAAIVDSTDVDAYAVSF